MVYEAMNSPEKAEACFKRAMLLGENGLGSDRHDVSSILESYATLLRTLKRAGEAAKLEARAKQLAAKERGPGPK